MKFALEPDAKKHTKLPPDCYKKLAAEAPGDPRLVNLAEAKNMDVAELATFLDGLMVERHYIHIYSSVLELEIHVDVMADLLEDTFFMMDQYSEESSVVANYATIKACFNIN